MKTDDRMPEEFYDWIDSSPIRWQSFMVRSEGIEYFFPYPSNEELNEVNINIEEINNGTV
jgi:hypothetical protein|tara:strand:+ start:1220 stop:1399 length:180 start_codon:yes stop_codon:yes gene_type:complete